MWEQRRFWLRNLPMLLAIELGQLGDHLHLADELARRAFGIQTSLLNTEMRVPS